MPSVLVRHGAVRYRVPRKGKVATLTAFRGMTVDMPQEEIDRLEPLGAVVKPGSELERDGKMMPLPNTASDEELIAWVSVATKAEIAAQIAETPLLGDRISTAALKVKEALAAQNELLGGLQETVDEGMQLAAEREQAEAKAAAQGAQPGAEPEADANAGNVSPEAGGDPSAVKGAGDNGGDAGGPNLDAIALAKVVSQSIPKVSEYLSEHPEQASAVLEAEKVRAAQPDAKPDTVREGIIKAVTAAAQHASQ